MVSLRILLTLLCITFTVSVASRADVDSIEFYELNVCPPTYESRFPIDFSWIIERYDFDRIEKYVDEYYVAYYKYCEYLAGKQREFAGKFGLSDVFLKPDFRRYEDTRVVFSKSILDDMFTLRYLAPLGDMWDFELFVAFKPQRFVTVILRGEINGERSVALVINGPFGVDNSNKNATRRIRRLLNQARKLVR